MIKCRNDGGDPHAVIRLYALTAHAHIGPYFYRCFTNLGKFINIAKIFELPIKLDVKEGNVLDIDIVGSSRKFPEKQSSGYCLFASLNSGKWAILFRVRFAFSSKLNR